MQSNRRFSTGSALRATLAAPTWRALSIGLLDSIGPSVLGIAFWVLAARRATADSLGRSAVLVLVMVAVAAAARLGLASDLLRQPNQRPNPAGSPSASGLGIMMALAAAGAGIFIGGLDVWAPSLSVFRDSSAMLLVIVAGAALIAALASLADSTTDETWSASGFPAGHLGLGALRLVLLLLLADRAARYGVVLAWVVPVPVVMMSGIVLGDRRRRASGLVDLNATDPRPVRHDHAASAVGWITLGAVALIVLGDRGPEGAALFVAAWFPAHAVYRLVTSFADAAITEPVPDGQLTDRFRLVRVLETMILATPVVVALVILAPYVLRAFGPGYDRSTTMLRILLVASIPVVAVRLVTGRRPPERRRAIGNLIHVGSGLLVVGLSGILVGWFPLTGAGVALLLVVTVVACGVLLEQSVWWWGQRLPDGAAVVVGRWITRRDSLHARSGRRLLNREVNDALGALYQSLPGWRRLWTTADRQAVSVAGHEGRPPFRVELARSKAGVAVLAQRVAAVSAVNETDGIGDLRRLVPYPIEHVDERSSGYLVESAVSGEPGTEPVPVEVGKQRVNAVLGAVGELHRATGQHLTLDGDTLDHWVTRPLRYLGDACRLPDSELVSIGRILFEGLEGAQVRFAQLHGNLRLDNTLFEPGGARLTGILDWEWSERGPVLADLGVLTLSALALQQRRDVGPIVRRLLDNPSPFAEHPAFVSDLGNDLSPRALVLLAWLHYLKPVLLAVPDGGVGDYWTARHVQPVLSRLRASD